MDKSYILIVDDDNRLRNLLRQYLSQNGFEVLDAPNAVSAEKIIQNFHVDLMILDVMMPGLNGIEFTRQLRAENELIPILMLTAMGQSQDRLNGLKSGVDDYLTKPFNPEELLIRIQNILKKQIRPHFKNEYVFSDFKFLLDKKELYKGDEFIALTSVEKELLTILIKSVGVEISREVLGQKMKLENERSIDVQINRLRKKIEKEPSNPRYLTTVRGKGYLFLPD